MEKSFQILQINLISARDLATVSKSMSTYAMVWIDPTRKMRTRVDQDGNNCPQWNDKFPFRLSSEFLHSDEAMVTIEIYAVSWIRDTIVGSVRVPVSSIIPANPTRQARRAVALQIRRPSGRPRGICNITVSLLDSSMQSMPLSALDENIHTHPEKDQKSDVASQLRRVKSERSCLYDDAPGKPKSMCNGSEVNIPGGSMCNSDVGPSPSVVAWAVAKGLYVPPRPPGRGGAKGNYNNALKDDGESSILLWADEESEEGVMTKIERWKTELNRPVHIDNGVRKHRNGHRKRRSAGGGPRLFRCFGNGIGFEFTIVCGANQDNNNNKHNNNNNHNNNNKNKNGKVHRKRIHLPSSSDGDS